MATHQYAGQCLHFRLIEPGDLADVVSNEASAYDYPWTERTFRDCLGKRQYQCWLMLVDGQPVGHGVLSSVIDEVHLLNLCVAAHAQGQGFGRLLLEWLLDRARLAGARVMFLEVRASNHRAARLYDGFGFNEVGVRPGYYPARGGREAARVMALQIDALND